MRFFVMVHQYKIWRTSILPYNSALKLQVLIVEFWWQLANGSKKNWFRRELRRRSWENLRSRLVLRFLRLESLQVETNIRISLLERSRNEITFGIFTEQKSPFASTCSFKSLLSPLAARPRSILFISERTNTRFSIDWYSVFPSAFNPRRKKTFGNSWDWTQVILLFKWLLLPLSHGSMSAN